MIRTVETIKDFGVFAGFQWPTGLPGFKRYNLIYGWNYSGKTTLSRAFRCFEQGQHHADFAHAQVRLKAADGTLYDLSASQTPPVFRVFNSDFVRENLSFSDGSATPILVLGAEDIAKQNLLVSKKTERDLLLRSKSANQASISEKTTGIDKELTRYARDFIKIPLAEVNYDKRRLEPKVVAHKAAYTAHLLDDEALRQYLAIHNSKDKKPAIFSKVNPFSSVASLREDVVALLSRVVTARNPIQRLKEDSAVERWVNEGRPLHEEKENCQFCGQPLPKDLMAQLTDHFSADYDNMMENLKALVARVKAAKEESIDLGHKADFYPEFSDRFTCGKKLLAVLAEARSSALEVLFEALEEKKTNAFQRLECPAVEDVASRVADLFTGINGLISEHNARTAQFDRKRKEAFEKIEMHYVAKFIRDEKYNQTLQKIAELKTAVEEQDEALRILEADILQLATELSEATRAAERINELLRAYFGKDDLRVVVSADKRFQILRGNVVAKNLSEGERTAIAFAYFIIRVQDGKHPLQDTRVVVDDPISSLDANHLFNTYALIKTQLSDCKQLFIATHSFEFYNLIREWALDTESAKKPQSDWKEWGVFLLKRINDGTTIIEEIPKELLRFKSEYHYLFSVLYQFDKTGANAFDSLLSLPNVVRRFMEAFGGIMIPLSSGLKGKMGRLFPDAVERERVWKFINHYSHNTTIARSLSIPDMGECKAVVDSCLKAVQRWDADYFNDLESEVN